MKVLSMILMLFVTANGIINFQDNLEPTLNEIIEVIKQSSEFYPIKEWLSTYTSKSYSMHEKTVGKTFYMVHNRIKKLNIYFINSVGTYFKNILKFYCQKALEIILQMSDQNIIFNDMTIDDHDFCIVTYLDVFKYDTIGSISRTTHFLKTISFHGPSYYSSKYLSEQLYGILKNELGFDENLDDQTSNKNVQDLANELMSIKNDIKKFSNIFCVPSLLPLIDKDIFTKEDKRKKDPFIGYIIKKESCCINMQVFLTPNKMPRKFRDEMWDCNEILINATSNQYKKRFWNTNKINVQLEKLRSIILKCMNRNNINLPLF